MARQSAWRTTEIADHTMMAKSQRKTAISVAGCATISTRLLPVAKKMATVPALTKSADSARTALRQLSAPRLGSSFSDMRASISKLCEADNPCLQIAGTQTRLSASLAHEAHRAFL